jgi:DNA repair exonuclease SbcCD ATPase subunit
MEEKKKVNSLQQKNSELEKEIDRIGKEASTKFECVTNQLNASQYRVSDLEHELVNNTEKIQSLEEEVFQKTLEQDILREQSTSEIMEEKVKVNSLLQKISELEKEISKTSKEASTQVEHVTNHFKQSTRQLKDIETEAIRKLELHVENLMKVNDELEESRRSICCLC